MSSRNLQESDKSLPDKNLTDEQDASVRRFISLTVKVGLSWLALMVVLSPLIMVLFMGQEVSSREVFNLVALWLGCMLEILSLSGFVYHLLGLGNRGKNRKLRAGTIVWGLIKVTCLAILVIILEKASAAPAGILVAGLSTLILVPLVSGVMWSYSR